MVVSDGLRSTLIWSKFQNFLGKHAPPPNHAKCYIWTENCMLCASPKKAYYVCPPPPLLQSLDPSLLLKSNLTVGKAKKQTLSLCQIWNYSATFQFTVLAHLLSYCKQSKAGRWEYLGERLSYMHGFSQAQHMCAQSVAAQSGTLE